MTEGQAIFTAEQEELRATARRFLQDRFPSETVRELMETPEGFTEATWKEMASMGWAGIHIPEQYGGAGYGYTELAILLEEMGKVLVCAPFFSSAVLSASAVLNAATDEQKRQILPGIVEGSERAALAFVEPEGRWEAGATSLKATRKGSRYTLRGTKRYVIDGATATLLVVTARSDDGIGLFVVDPNAEGVKRTEMETLDLTRKQASIDFENAPADLLGDVDSGEAAISTTLDEAAVALSAESLGGAQRCLDMATEYAGHRTAFGRAIGSFQAIKHRLANLLMEVENARSGAYYAAWTVGEAPEDLPVAACMAKAYCSEAFFHAACDSIQVHGGIGFTWEHDAHLYLRRAKSSEIYLGDGNYHRELLAQRVGV